MLDILNRNPKMVEKDLADEFISECEFISSLFENLSIPKALFCEPELFERDLKNQAVSEYKSIRSQLENVGQQELLRCDPKLLEKDLTGQVIIVTGANSGIGFETAKQLVKQNATVILGCRSEYRGGMAALDLNYGENDSTNSCKPVDKTAKEKAVFITPLDLASLSSIRAFVTAFLSRYDRLDALINNAGVSCPFSRTKDGFEMQIGTNHLGHFLLMRLLTPLLIQTAEKYGKPSRFVALSSVAAAPMSTNEGAIPDIDFDDLNYETREYESWEAYAQSKLANYLHAMEAAERYPKEKLISTSVHPGFVVSNLGREAIENSLGKGWLTDSIIGAIQKVFVWKGDAIYPDEGCQTTLHCLLEDGNKIQNGKFYSQIGFHSSKEFQEGGWPMELPNRNATREKAKKLWEVSEGLVGLSALESEKLTGLSVIEE